MSCACCKGLVAVFHLEILKCWVRIPRTMPPAQELRHRAPTVPSSGTPSTHSAAHFSSAALAYHSGVGLNASGANRMGCVLGSFRLQLGCVNVTRLLRLLCSGSTEPSSVVLFLLFFGKYAQEFGVPLDGNLLVMQMHVSLRRICFTHMLYLQPQICI